MMNSHNKKAELDGLSIILLILLGIRLLFTGIIFVNSLNIIYFIFALCYFFALLGTYMRELYGPVIGAIIISVDLLFAFTLTGNSSYVIGAIVVDITILVISVREFNVINNIVKRKSYYFSYGTPNFTNNSPIMSENQLRTDTDNTDPDKSKEYGYRSGQ